MACYRHYAILEFAIIAIASIVNIADANIVIITSLITISIDICRYRNSFVLYTVQLKCNLVPACRLVGEKVEANLQMGMGEGVGIRNVLQQPSMNLWQQYSPLYELLMLYHLFTAV